MGYSEVLFTLKADEEVLRVLQERRRFSFAYVGPALGAGRIDAIVLAEGLRGKARLVNRIAEMYLGPQSDFVLQVEGEPNTGSIEIFVGFEQVFTHLADSKVLAGVAVIMGISGFSLRDAGKSIWALFKKLRGQPITDETNLTELLPENVNVDRTLFIRMYNDQEIQAALRAALRPLRESGIEKFETRVERSPIETVTKADLQAADTAETDAIIADEEKVLDIEKASFLPHLSWHLSDEGKPFDAKVEDPYLWERVAAGDKFGFGDKLRVTLHTSAERDVSGRLRVVKTVTKVHTIERASGSQIEMFPEGRSE